MTAGRRVVETVARELRRSGTSLNKIRHVLGLYKSWHNHTNWIIDLPADFIPDSITYVPVPDFTFTIPEKGTYFFLMAGNVRQITGQMGSAFLRFVEGAAPKMEQVCSDGSVSTLIHQGEYLKDDVVFVEMRDLDGRGMELIAAGSALVVLR